MHETISVQPSFPEQLPIATEGTDADVRHSAVIALKQVILATKPVDNQILMDAVDAYESHSDHGAVHGVATYRGMNLILHDDEEMKSACKTRGIDELIIQYTSFFHDVGQLSGVASLLRDGRTDHARRIATITQYVGRHTLHLDDAPLRLMVDALEKHDDVLKGKIVDVSNNPLLAVLSDADKLYGAGATDNPKELMVGLLERNLKGSRGEKGWYFFRDDLSPNDRLSWRYGSRWRLDGLSAVLNETYRVPFFTQHARRVSRLRNASFLEAIENVYGGEFDKIRDWVGIHRTDWDIVKVGKNMPETFLEKTSSFEDLLLRAREVKNELIPGVGNEDGVYRGIKLKLRAGDSELVIDPGLFEFLFTDKQMYDPDNACQRFVDTVQLSRYEYLNKLV